MHHMTGVAARNAPAVPTPRIPSEVTDLDRRSFRRASTLIAERFLPLSLVTLKAQSEQHPKGLRGKRGYLVYCDWQSLSCTMSKTTSERCAFHALVS